MTCRIKTGEIRTCLFFSAMILMGEKTHILSTIEDITDRKRAEDALKQKTAELDGFFSVALDLLCIANTDGYFLLLNPAWEQIMGYSCEELMAQRFLDFVHPDDLPPTMDALATLRNQNAVLTFTNRYRCKDGSYRWLEWRGAPSGTIIYAAARDITERKLAEEALQKAIQQLNLLSSITRHDIKNQLLALRGYLELSKDCLDDRAQVAEFIRKEEQAAETIDQQITFTREYQELGAVAPCWQNVNAGIQQTVASLPMRAIRVEVDCTDVDVYADPLFAKVFYNLLDNALRYGGDGMTRIRISAEFADDRLVLRCEDDGVGITGKDKKRLFTKGFGKHTGLGLFLSREILAITGITISENGIPGNGARFEMSVPKGMWRMAGGGA